MYIVQRTNIEACTMYSVHCKLYIYIYNVQYTRFPFYHKYKNRPLTYLGDGMILALVVVIMMIMVVLVVASLVVGAKNASYNNCR